MTDGLGTDNAGSLTKEQVQAILVEPLVPASVIMSAGVQIFDTDGSPVRVPTLTTQTDPAWTAENEQIDDTQKPGFDEVKLLPQTMKSLKIIVRFSNELARQSVVALDAALRRRLVTDVAGKVDAAAEILP